MKTYLKGCIAGILILVVTAAQVPNFIGPESDFTHTLKVLTTAVAWRTSLGVTNGTVLPPDAVGSLTNDGVGHLAWGVITGGGGGVVINPSDQFVGYRSNSTVVADSPISVWAGPDGSGFFGPPGATFGPATMVLSSQSLVVGSQATNIVINPSFAGLAVYSDTTQGDPTERNVTASVYGAGNNIGTSFMQTRTNYSRIGGQVIKFSGSVQSVAETVNDGANQILKYHIDVGVNNLVNMEPTIGDGSPPYIFDSTTTHTTGFQTVFRNHQTDIFGINPDGSIQTASETNRWIFRGLTVNGGTTNAHWTINGTNFLSAMTPE